MKKKASLLHQGDKTSKHELVCVSVKKLSLGGSPRVSCGRRNGVISQVILDCVRFHLLALRKSGVRKNNLYRMLYLDAH